MDSLHIATVLGLSWNDVIILHHLPSTCCLSLSFCVCVCVCVSLSLSHTHTHTHTHTQSMIERTSLYLSCSQLSLALCLHHGDRHLQSHYRAPFRGKQQLS